MTGHGWLDLALIWAAIVGAGWGALWLIKRSERRTARESARIRAWRPDYHRGGPVGPVGLDYNGEQSAKTLTAKSWYSGTIGDFSGIPIVTSSLVADGIAYMLPSGGFATDLTGDYGKHAARLDLGPMSSSGTMLINSESLAALLRPYTKRPPSPAEQWRRLVEDWDDAWQDWLTEFENGEMAVEA